MRFSISVLFLASISICCALIKDAGRRHESSSASSDFIHAEKCAHCARHDGSSSQPASSQKVMIGSSKSQESSNRDAESQTNASLDRNVAASERNSLITLFNDKSEFGLRKQSNNSEVDNSKQLEITDERPSSKDESNLKFPNWLSLKQISKSVKYALANFLPESPVDTISKNWNQSRHGGNSSTFKSMYPIVLEGISVLANRLTNDQDEEDPIEDSAINGLMNTINEALKFDDMPAEDQSNPAQTRHGKGGNAFKGIEKLIESGFLKNAVSLVGQVLKDDDFQNITSHLMNKSDVKILFNKVSDVLQTTVSGLENAVKHQDLFLAMAKSTNGSSSPIDLANIVSQYVSKNGTAIGGDLSDNPLLQSAIVAKALAKSPVARLGALDESVKKLVTSSMEGAMSRIRIGENGQIQMSSGMRKMLEKMVEEHEKSSNGTTDGSSDSIMNMIQLVVKSGSIKEINPVDTGPVKRRNVTRHSPLHQKFQQKYGKSGGYATSVQSGLHHTLVGMLLLIVLPMVR